GLGVAVHEDGLGRVVVEGHGHVGHVEVAGLELHIAAGRVHVRVDGAVTERDVGDHLVHLHGVSRGLRLAAVLLTEVAGLLHPLVTQECVLVGHGLVLLGHIGRDRRDASSWHGTPFAVPDRTLTRWPRGPGSSASPTASGTPSGNSRRFASRCRSASTATPACATARPSSAPSSITAWT